MIIYNKGRVLAQAHLVTHMIKYMNMNSFLSSVSQTYFKHKERLCEKRLD